MKFKNIVKKSKKIIKYTRKNYQLPPNMDKASTLYLLARAVNDIGKNKKVIRVKTTEVAKTKPVKIVLNRYQYRIMVSYIVDYMDEYKTNPTDVPFVNEKSINLCIYVLAKIIYSYSKNKKLPKKITCDSSIFVKPKKKFGRSTQTGCDNRGQNTGYFCACHMAQEIVRNLTGIVVKQSTIASVMGTTTSGTGHPGINTFFAWFNKTYNQNLKVEWKNFSDVGWSGIEKILESNDKDAGIHEMYRRTSTSQGFGHYTNFDKIYDGSVDVHNSLGNKCNYGCYCGYTENRSKSEAKYYIDGISQKSVLVVTNEK